MAYNAGGGNLRKWKKAFGDLPPLLFIEAVPYKQTRDYVRKNLTALIIYNKLYYGISPEGTVNDFFTE